MSMTDQEFREEFKPVQIPPSYNSDDSPEDRTLFALASLGEANAEEVFEKLQEYEPNPVGLDISFISQYLHSLYENGLLKGTGSQPDIRYNLSKITSPHKGYIDPDLLSPGLD